MDRVERTGDPLVAIRAVVRGDRANLWTALPATVISYDAAKQTVEAQIAIQMQILSPQGEWSNVSVKPCPDCPVLFLGGGGYSVTFPIEAGDEGLLVFSSRCIDGWYENGGDEPRPQTDLRMHDLSDGFFIPGFRSQPNKLDDVSEDALQIRNADGSVLVEVGEDGIRLKGNVTIEGDVTVEGDVEADGVSLKTHLHGGVTVGAGNTGAPIP